MVEPQNPATPFEIVVAFDARARALERMQELAARHHHADVAGLAAYRGKIRPRPCFSQFERLKRLNPRSPD